MKHNLGWTEWAPWRSKGETRVVASEAQWKLPLKWHRAAKAAGERHRVFCASLADVFEDWRGDMTDSSGEEPSWDGINPVSMQGVRARLFDLIDDTRNLDWLLLTKRPENVTAKISQLTGRYPSAWLADCSNVWIGTSVENQVAADERIPHLLKIPASMRFLSVEPLLGPVDLDDYLHPDVEMLHDFSGISWVVIGGESDPGPGARPCLVKWIRDLVQQCKSAGVPVFVKQLGARPDCGPFDREEGAFPRCWNCGHYDFGPCSDGTLICNGCDSSWRGRLRDRNGADMAEWPADLRVREFPTPQRSA